MRVNNLIPGFCFVDHFRITNPPTTEGYAVPFTLTHIPGSDPLFRDILPMVGDQVLPFWIEHAAGTTISTNTPFTSPKIWIRLPKGCTDVDIYRKNPRMTADRSDGNRTFDFFDDFNIDGAPDSNKWTLVTTGGTPVVSGGILNNKQTGGNGTNTETKPGNILPVGSFAIRTYLKTAHAASTSYAESFPVENVAGGKQFTAGWSHSYTGINGKYNAVNPGWGTPLTMTGWSANVYHVQDIIRDNTNSKFIWKVDNANTVEMTENYFSDACYFHYFCYNFPNSEINVDWVLVRKYQSPEPTPILLSTKTNPLYGGR